VYGNRTCRSSLGRHGCPGACSSSSSVFIHPPSAENLSKILAFGHCLTGSVNVIGMGRVPKAGFGEPRVYAITSGSLQTRSPGGRG
jgi:hypothetical protein